MKKQRFLSSMGLSCSESFMDSTDCSTNQGETHHSSFYPASTSRYSTNFDTSSVSVKTLDQVDSLLNTVQAMTTELREAQERTRQ